MVVWPHSRNLTSLKKRSVSLSCGTKNYEARLRQRNIFSSADNEPPDQVRIFNSYARSKKFLLRNLTKILRQIFWSIFRENPALTREGSHCNFLTLLWRPPTYRRVESSQSCCRGQYPLFHIDDTDETPSSTGFKAVSSNPIDHEKRKGCEKRRTCQVK